MDRKFDIVGIILALVVVFGVLIMSALEGWPNLVIQPRPTVTPIPIPVLAPTWETCPIPVDSMCWCVSAKDGQVYVQEIARPSSKPKE